jgi:hypothetical protein
MTKTKKELVRGKQRPRSLDLAPGQELVSRKVARRVLGNVSESMLVRLEKRGVLRAVRLSPSSAAQVFYTRANVMAVVNGNPADC